MKFSFVILTWNRKAFLERCIASLTKSAAGSDYEVIVLDNGSDDGTDMFLRTLAASPNFRRYRNRKNKDINAYKKLFRKARGEYVVIVDDDVIDFPEHITSIFEEYFDAFREFGFLALDVVQNDFTNGAKPPASDYKNVIRGDKIVQEGPTGGWCTAFRRSDFKKLRFRFYVKPLSMKSGEDGMLANLFASHLGLKSGIIKGKYCLHASGPYFSKAFGYLERDIKKYETSDLERLAAWYRFFR